MIDWDALVAAATKARARAYAPYSRFLVGAALIDDQGRVHTGCNVENASYGLTICAERAAVFVAINEGARAFRALAVVSSVQPPAMPCGGCRQVLREFAPDLPVVASSTSGQRVETSLERLLPDSFGPDTLVAATPTQQ